MLSYLSLHNIFIKIIKVERHMVLIKQDIRGVFRNIFVASQIQWLLDFKWKEYYYQKTYLLFSFSTLPFIFNLFIEVLYWILENYFYFFIEHYFNNFIATILHVKVTSKTLAWYENQYKIVIDILGIFCRESKNKTKTIILIFSIEVNTNLFKASLSVNKIDKTIFITVIALLKNFLILKKT